MVGSMKFKVADENAVDNKYTNVKKFGVANTENTKRLLGDLQNRGVLRNVAGKEAAEKDLKDAKPQNNAAVRSAKPRVDTHWKKAPLGTTTNAASNAATNNAAGQRKVLTRSNSVRLGTSNATTTASSGLGLQRHASSNLMMGQNKPKTTLTTKMVENKLQQVKFVNKSKPQQQSAVEDKKEPTLRREDSNLSLKSLSKLKAALQRDNVVSSTKPVVKSNSAPSSTTQLQAKKVESATTTESTTEKSKLLNTKITANAVASKLKTVSAQSHSSKLLKSIDDIDAGDEDNLVLVSEYVNDIYDYLYTLEVEHAINENHLEGQEEVYAKMRAVLIDWINEVHAQFHLAPETYQMAVAIIDRYLQIVKDTKRSHLQLVGVTALFIAAKYEELFPPAINDFVYITDDTYTTKQILQMELKIFKALDCNLSRPLPIHFLRRFSKAAKAEDSHHTMSKYFLELASIEYDLAAYKPSEIAAASLFLSLHLLDGNAKVGKGFDNSHWTPTLQWYSRYSAEHLRPITKKIATLARNAASAKLQAVYNKYQSSKLHKISLRWELYSASMDSIIQSKNE